MHTSNHDPLLYAILMIVSFAGLLSPISSTIYYPGLIDIQKELHTSEDLVSATISLYVLFMGIAPLMWASLSDTYGRRLVYLGSLSIYTVANVGCALSVNIAMLLVMRVIQACGSSSKGTAMGLFFMGPLIGPIIGPIIGGYMNEYLGWRYIFYFLCGLGGLTTLVIFFLLPETFPAKRLKRLHPEISFPKKKRLGPIDALKLLRFPTVAMTIFYVSVVYGSLYLVTTEIPRTFANLYHLSSSSIGLTYLASGCGNVGGALLGGRMTDWMTRRAQRKQEGTPNEGKPVPSEVRLLSAHVGSILLPASLIGYGWIIQKSHPLYAALICLFFNGMGMMFVFTACSTFLVDAFPRQSASAVSVNNFCRSLFAAVGSLVSGAANRALGPGILMVICACLSILGSIFLVIIQRWGHRWPNPK
ncbi:major facilitator superfamily domain-containing protein [Piptocephalis cylindrospora]|uniref:Major facilitator superfamily domain-containing protein n=1 Tax=Piptocephalis cylindrospora TaxID=1907219 RepID=A0A4V1IXY0_9FUNG|nr:major facilitator superfamily domain-containing protein [Piptocephalis cylindrospora]|eukprot:RKP12629.1 major facilitator superfamily domain-containing protein [Piptocephalis cylindrospora]